MSEENKNSKVSATAQREEEILKLWKEKDVFQKTLDKESPKGNFVFYDGPPFATGLPHHGSLLSSIVKDVIPRYKTMQGFHVRRRWGWDTHGLPIESLVEKELGLKTKKDILDIGIGTFNKKAKSMVLQFVHDWEKYVERIGRWVDFKNSYKTMDNTYIESVWWAIKQLNDRGLLYEGRKVLMYCPHCETPLAKAEIAMDNTYKDITEEAVTVRFRIVDPEKHDLPQGTSVLAWTTTPWTLPGNIALAVGREIEYVVATFDRETIVAAKARLPEGAQEVRSISAEELTSLSYEPLYDVPELKTDTAYKIYFADFVSTEDGTGVVHTAVMYGEDDFRLGQEAGLPMVQLLNPNGTYNDKVPEFIRGEYIKKAEKAIKADLETRGLLFKKENNTHSYPHCYRCGTPLIYNAVSSWFINIQKVKEKMLSENEKVNWVPEHLKHGRFRHIVENAPDWTISRNRFWASPLPIWKEEGGNRVMVIGSVGELKEKVKKNGNTFFVMRHGEAEHNLKNIASRDIKVKYKLTDLGREQVKQTAKKLKDAKIDLIVTSPLLRSQETAEIVRDLLGLGSDAVAVDERLTEIDFGDFEGKSVREYHDFFGNDREVMLHAELAHGENFLQVKKRVGDCLYELDNAYKGKKIVLVTHSGPAWMLFAAANALDDKATAALHNGEWFIDPAEARELDFVPLPHDENYELDLHRPYADDLVLVDEEGKEYARIPEVLDCWVESGSMPFAEYHYPFENKEEYETRAPGDFIAEYIAQTRTWFYYMHAMSVLLFDRLAFKNVVTTGTILAGDGEKLSKSKRNYTDPLELIGTYGSDALRLHLMGSPVMQAEDLRFRDEDVREMHNRFIGILWNTFKFYELYKKDYDGTDGRKSSHVLDRWIYARLDETTKAVTDAMDAYTTPEAVRALKSFVDDYSTWYVRRSRDRVKGEGEDKQFALGTQREVLHAFSRLIAPLSPFIAESIYLGVGGERESVHLEAWPEAVVFDREVLQEMQLARELVSRGLEARARAGIKVRQPLSSITVSPLKAEFVPLLTDELNVEKVVFKEGLADLELDTAITPGLKEKGTVRELIRMIQELRKKAGLHPSDAIKLTLSGDAELLELAEKNSEQLKRSLIAREMTRGEGGEEIEIDGSTLKVKIER